MRIDRKIKKEEPIMRMAVFCPVLFILTALSGCSSGRAKDYPIEPLPFTAVRIEDSFWSPRMETNRRVTVPFDFKKCEETGRISNFAKAAGLEKGEFEGIYFNDSDVYKIIEGAAYTLSLSPDPELEKYVDSVIDRIAAAQWEDGYLYTFYSVPEKQPGNRWTNIKDKHEMYCAGHFFEAAVAYYQATGKRKIFDVAVRLADHIASVFGPGKRNDVPGHQEIEIGLVKLYRMTGEKKYLNLAKFFLDQRGNTAERKTYGTYHQDHMPVVEQTEAVGHAVRAGYMYSGMADVAALTGDPSYIKAIDRIWDNIVSKRMYLTGGIGSSRRGESFGENYELPNLTAYNETCAAIANAMWNHRLFLLHGDARYLDVLERVLYNGFLSGISFSGDLFFYPNPLESDGIYKFNSGGTLTRQPWFDCSCCPSNVVRFLPSIAGTIYATRGRDVYVNLFIGSEASFGNGHRMKIKQSSAYPWEGRIILEIEPEKAESFTLFIRIPGWAVNRPVPGDLYRYLDPDSAGVELSVNNEDVPLELENGFALLRRTWKSGDRVEIRLPMGVKRVVANENVREDLGKVALERGPVVYCLEGADHGGRVLDLALEDNAWLGTEFRQDLLNGVTVIRGTGYRRPGNGKSQETSSRRTDILAVPYYAWNHRGPGEMAVWMLRN